MDLFGKANGKIIKALVFCVPWRAKEKYSQEDPLCGLSAKLFIFKLQQKTMIRIIPIY